MSLSSPVSAGARLYVSSLLLIAVYGFVKQASEQISDNLLGFNFCFSDLLFLSGQRLYCFVGSLSRGFLLRLFSLYRLDAFPVGNLCYPVLAEAVKYGSPGFVEVGNRLLLPLAVAVAVPQYLIASLIAVDGLVLLVALRFFCKSFVDASGYRAEDYSIMSSIRSANHLST